MLQGSEWWIRRVLFMDLWSLKIKTASAWRPVGSPCWSASVPVPAERWELRNSEGEVLLHDSSTCVYLAWSYSATNDDVTQKALFPGAACRFTLKFCRICRIQSTNTHVLFFNGSLPRVLNTFNWWQTANTDQKLSSSRKHLAACLSAQLCRHIIDVQIRSGTSGMKEPTNIRDIWAQRSCFVYSFHP